MKNENKTAIDLLRQLAELVRDANPEKDEGTGYLTLGFDVEDAIALEQILHRIENDEDLVG